MRYSICQTIFFIISCFFVVTNALLAQVSESDSSALVQVYEATGGNNWTNKSGWLVAPVSEWHGITVEMVNEQMRVTEIDLSNNNLTGAFDFWQPNFQEVQVLRLNGNQLTKAGTGETFVRMKKLRIFNASDNQLNHAFPNIRYTKQLEEISLSNNQLGGIIPDLNGHKNLKRLYLDNNNFSDMASNTKVLPPYLESISLENNRLNFSDIDYLLHSISLDETEVSYAPQKTLPLNLNIHNYLSAGCGYNNQQIVFIYKNGSLLEEITETCGQKITESGSYRIEITHETLTNTAVSSQNLTLESLELMIDLDNPRIVDSITLVNIYKTMGGANWHESYTNTWLQTPLSEWKGVDMHDDGLAVERISAVNAWTDTPAPLIGPLPDMNFEDLRSIFFRDNGITGILPDFPQSLESIRANSNYLEGELHVFNEMPNLVEIFLSANHFSGELPTLEGSPKIEAIVLDHNDLIGPIPPEWNDLDSLNRFYMMGCNLSGTIDLQEMDALEWFNLNGNQFTKLETDFTQMPNFLGGQIADNRLNFDGLEINAALHDTVLHYEGQKRLPLQYDAATGKLFVSAGGTAANNTFTWYKNDEQITQNVGDSTLSITEGGQYQVDVHNSLVTKLDTENQDLVLYGREYFGTLDCLTQDQLALVALADHADIDLWHNGADTTWFSDKPMDEWAGITMSEDGCSVESLDLRDVGLDGTLPYLNFSNIKAITFAGNKDLQGFLDINHLHTLEYLVIGETGLEGKLPEFTQFPNLQHFTARWRSNFSGEIPAIAGLDKLTQFALIGHNLTGQLPSFDGLLSMEKLMIGGTQITGSIPDISAMTQLKELNLGDNELDGAIPDLSGLDQLTQIALQRNNFNFDDLEPSVLSLQDKQLERWEYAPQNEITIDCENKKLVVYSAGGKDSDNTYTWVHNHEVIQQSNSNELVVTRGDWHEVEVTNAIVTNPNDERQNLILTGFYKVDDVENPCNECEDSANDLDLPAEIILCEGETLMLSANLLHMDTYIWDFNGELFAETADITVSEAGTYLLGVVDFCGGTKIDTIEVILGNETQCNTCGLDGCVWPGDTNNNGVANIYDILAIGLAYNEQGNIRPNASLDWVAQACPNWAVHLDDDLHSDVNAKHADTNGDGIVDENDIDAILENYGQEHGKAGQPSVQSGVPLFADSISFRLTDTINTYEYIFDVHLGDESNPAEGVYGLAFEAQVRVAADSIDVGPPFVDFKNTWLDDGSKLLQRDKCLMSEEKWAVGITRTNKTSITGHGPICRVNCIIEITGVGKTTIEPPAMEVVFTKVHTNNEHGKQVDINYVTNAEEKPVLRPRPNIQLYPNPAQEDLYIGLKEGVFTEYITNISIYNMLGKKVVATHQSLQKGQNRLAVNLMALPRGTYIIQLQNGDFLASERVIVAR